MSQNHQLLLLSFLALLLLVAISKCHSYPWFNELTVPERPMKFHSQNEMDRYVNRMKQYYDTMAQLRLWRRDISASSEDYDETLQDMLRQNTNLSYKR